MALLPSTAETRMVPVAGRQFAQRRLIRGVGAAERSVGNAWGRMTSRQREYYGSQKNFARGLQGESTRRKEKQEAAEGEADREQGRQDAMQDAADTPSAPEPLRIYQPVNNADDVLGKTLRKARMGKLPAMNQSGQDR